MNDPHIQVYQYLVYNGGFARERTLLWTYALVGANKERKTAAALDFGWAGSKHKENIMKRAEEWAAFTGWPINDMGRCVLFDESPKDVRRRIG